jgi:dienelactone hydrolase
VTPDRIDIPNGTPEFTGQLYKPSGTATTGLVVIAYGTDGFADTTRGPWKKIIFGYAEDLAARGLFALIPDYFAKTGSPHGGEAARDIETKRRDWATALVDTVTVARTLPRVDPSRVGMLGFSLGGHLCLLARAAAKPKALVEFFAPMFDGIGPAGHVPIAQIHHGKKDTGMTDFKYAAEIERLLKLEGTDVKGFGYDDATHGFASPSAADKKAATDSKESTLKFFQSRL